MFPWNMQGSKVGMDWVDPQHQITANCFQGGCGNSPHHQQYLSFHIVPYFCPLLTLQTSQFFCWSSGCEVITYYYLNFHHLIPHEGESLCWLAKGDFILQGSYSNLLPSFQLSYLWFFLNWYKERFGILNTSLSWMTCIENISAMLVKLRSFVPPQGWTSVHLGRIVHCTALKGANQKGSDKNAWPTCTILHGCLRGPWFLNQGTCG